MKPKYEIVLYWSDDDDVFVAEVSELTGCAAHGKTQEKALANVQEAIRLWVEVARETGRKVPQPRSRRSSRS